MIRRGLSLLILAELPRLRRHTRAMTGSRNTGDGAIAKTLERVAADPATFNRRLGSRLELFRLNHDTCAKIWPQVAPTTPDVSILAQLDPEQRAVITLAYFERFKRSDIATILAISEDRVRRVDGTARSVVTLGMRTRRLAPYARLLNLRRINLPEDCDAPE